MKKYSNLLLVTLSLLIVSCKTDSVKKSDTSEVKVESPKEGNAEVIENAKVTYNKSQDMNRLLELEVLRVEIDDLIYELNRDLKTLKK